MKRLLAILFLLCLAAGGDESEWKTQDGGWKEKDGVLTGDSGYIFSTRVLALPAEIEFCVTIQQWDSASPYQLAGVCWGTQQNMHFLVLRPKMVSVQNNQRRASVAAEIPTNKRIPCRVQVTQKSIRAQIGKTLVDQKNWETTEFSGFGFHCNGATAVFSKIKMKAKN